MEAGRRATKRDGGCEGATDIRSIVDKFWGLARSSEFSVWKMPGMRVLATPLVLPVSAMVSSRKRENFPSFYFTSCRYRHCSADT